MNRGRDAPGAYAPHRRFFIPKNMPATALNYVSKPKQPALISVARKEHYEKRIFKGTGAVG